MNALRLFAVVWVRTIRGNKDLDFAGAKAAHNKEKVLRYSQSLATCIVACDATKDALNPH